MNKRKKLLSWVLTIVMLLSLVTALPMTASAAPPPVTVFLDGDLDNVYFAGDTLAFNLTGLPVGGQPTGIPAGTTLRVSMGIVNASTFSDLQLLESLSNGSVEGTGFYVERTLNADGSLSAGISGVITSAPMSPGIVAVKLYAHNGTAWQNVMQGQTPDYIVLSSAGQPATVGLDGVLQMPPGITSVPVLGASAQNAENLRALDISFSKTIAPGITGSIDFAGLNFLDSTAQSQLNALEAGLIMKKIPVPAAGTIEQYTMGVNVLPEALSFLANKGATVSVSSVSFNGLSTADFQAAAADVAGGAVSNLLFNDTTDTVSFDVNHFSSYTLSVLEPDPVCQIDSTKKYYSLSDALAAFTDGQTIKLLADITHTNSIIADSKVLSIDLNGYDLTVENVAEHGHALQARNNGTLNISDINGKSGVLTVNSSGEWKYCVKAVSGGKVNIEGNLKASFPGGMSYQDIIGVFASDSGSAVNLTGNAFGHMAGIYAINGAVITVTGNVSGAYYGAYAAYGGSVDVTGNVSGSRALVTEYGGISQVQGDITGSNHAVETLSVPGWLSPIVKVTGNVTGTGGSAISASNDADIQINGNVTGYVVVSGSESAFPEITVDGDITVSSGFGVSIYYGGTVTVNGRILGASPYLKLDGKDIQKDDFVIEGDYYKYSNTTDAVPAPFGANSVYVLIPKNDAALSALAAPGITLSPAFNELTTSYTANAANNISKTTITASAKVSGAVVKINGTKSTSLETALNTGSNVITVEVTALDEVTTKTYTITINRAAAGGSSSGSGGSSIPGRTNITVSTTDGLISVAGNMTASEGITRVMIKNDNFKKMADSDKNVIINTGTVIVTFDQKAMDAIKGASGGDVTLSTREVDPSALPAEQKKLAGGRPVYKLTVMNDSTLVSDFKGGHATVTIPYTLKPGENPNAVVVCHLTADGKLKLVRGHYDAALKAVVFKTAHFSHFVIRYNPVVFTDVKENAWYKSAVDFIAAREITSGTGDNQFRPEAKLTRAQFVVLLMNTYQINTQNQGASYQIQNFTDAGNTYYTDYLLAAKALGIVKGVGNSLFAPEKEITRQEMFMMLYNALNVIDETPTATVNKKLSGFSDADQVADWAMEALSNLVEAGIVTGNNNKLNPTSSTTRAEITQVLYNLLFK